MIDTTKLKRLDGLRTKGEWEADLDREFIQGSDVVPVEAILNGYVQAEVCYVHLDTGENKDGEDWVETAANAAFIAEACKQVMPLIEENETLRAENAKLRESLKEALYHFAAQGQKDKVALNLHGIDKAIENTLNLVGISCIEVCSDHEEKHFCFDVSKARKLIKETP